MTSQQPQFEEGCTTSNHTEASHLWLASGDSAKLDFFGKVELLESRSASATQKFDFAEKVELQLTQHCWQSWSRGT